MSRSAELRTVSWRKLGVALGIVFACILIFAGEGGRLRIEDWIYVLDPTGGGGHHETWTTLLRRAVDPSYLQNDLFSRVGERYFIPFIFVFKLLFRWGFSLNLMVLLGEWAARLALLSAIYSVAKRLSSSVLVPWIVFLFFVRGRVVPGEHPVMSVTDWNMDLSLAFCLWSFLFFQNKEWKRAWLFLGFGTYFHFIYPVYLAGFYLIWWIYRFRLINLGRWLPGLGLGILSSLPFLLLMLPAAFNLPDPKLDETWKLIMLSSIGFHLQPLILVTENWPRHGFFVLSSVVGLVHFLSHRRDSVLADKQEILSALFLYMLGLGVVNVLFTEVVLSRPVMMGMPIRFLTFGLVLLLIFSIQWSSDRLKNISSFWHGAFWVSFMVLLFFSDSERHYVVAGLKSPPIGLLALIVVAAGVLSDWLKYGVKVGTRDPEKMVIKAGWVAVFAGLTLGITFGKLSFQLPERWSLRDDWKRVQLWARSNTSSSAVFLTPSVMAGFRIFSERASVGALHDLHLVMALNSSLTSVIAERLRKLEFPLITSLGTRREELRAAVRHSGFDEQFDRSLKKERLRVLGERIRFDYVIRKRSMPLSWEPVYENVHFSIYRMPGT